MVMPSKVSVTREIWWQMIKIWAKIFELQLDQTITYSTSVLFSKHSTKPHKSWTYTSEMNYYTIDVCRGMQDYIIEWNERKPLNNDMCTSPANAFHLKAYRKTFRKVSAVINITFKEINTYHILHKWITTIRKCHQLRSEK